MSRAMPKLRKARRQTVIFCSLLWPHYNTQQGVAEHPASPNGDMRNACRPTRVARFLRIDALRGLVGPCKPLGQLNTRAPPAPPSLSLILPSLSSISKIATHNSRRLHAARVYPACCQKQTLSNGMALGAQAIILDTGVPLQLL